MNVTPQNYSSRAMIERLIAFPTVSCDSNMALIDFIQEYLHEHGIEAKLVPNADATKANLYATIGPAVAGGVVLSGHTDVVPVDGQPWDTDPFVVSEKGGRLYGRGTCDMKSFIAIALALVPTMIEAMHAGRLRQPIHFAFSYDEEIGCLGAPSMIERIVSEFPAVRAVIVGEPSSMKVINSHKGITAYETTVTGHEAHSSQTHRGVSAVMNAARIVAEIDAIAKRKATAADQTLAVTPPYTTIHVGLIHGGTATNIISRECRFHWDIRQIPGDDPERIADEVHAFCERELLPQMRAVAPECGISHQLLESVPALTPEPNGEAERIARALTGNNDTGAAAYGAEAGQFQQAGMSTVICGPGSIDQAHKPNEYIELAQVEACERALRRLINPRL